MISGNVPMHLVVAARTGFLSAISTARLPWQRLAMQINMDAKAIDLVDLGAAPMPVENKGKLQVQDFIEKSLTIKPKDWEITVFISHNALSDDQTSSLDRRVRSAGSNFQRHLNNLVFKALDAGDTTTYGLCYDGSNFFDNDHVDEGAAYQTAQDNEGAAALTLDAFETALVAARGFRDDQGEFQNYNYDLLVVSPALERIAAQICGNREAYDTANREVNPYAGQFSYIVSPEMNTTAWVIAASSEPVKPLIVSMREQPNLQSAWFDPNAPDGGRFYFKFYARYNVHYGDYRLAYLGNS
jgi:phage major head subunit gpT-like protein